MYQEEHIYEQGYTAKRLSQKIAEKSNIRRKSEFKQKVDNVFALVALSVLLVPLIVYTCQGGDTAYNARQAATEAPKTQEEVKKVKTPKEDKTVHIQAVETKEKSPYKIGASDAQNEMVAYAYQISKNMDFIYMIESESGWVLDKVGQHTTYGQDLGLCQINSKYHPEIIKDKRFQNNDWKWELDTCWKMYNGGVTFCGANRMKHDTGFYEAVKANFNWK